MCLTDRKKTAPRKGAARVWERPSSYFLEAWEEDEDCGVARQIELDRFISLKNHGSL